MKLYQCFFTVLLLVTSSTVFAQKSTAFNSHLPTVGYVLGTYCHGTFKISDDLTCKKGQWLIEIDPNTCTIDSQVNDGGTYTGDPELSCEEMDTITLTAELKPIPNIFGTIEFEYFKVIPKNIAGENYDGLFDSGIVLKFSLLSNQTGELLRIKSLSHSGFIADQVQ